MNLNPSQETNSLGLITLTNNATLKVSELIKEEDNFKLNLRVFITGGGCSGFQYGFVFDENINDDDICVEKKITKKELEHSSSEKESDSDEEEETGTGSMSVKLIVDAMSYQYLMGAEIDYKSDIKGERFTIKNPMAKTTCGCGSSFSV